MDNKTYDIIVNEDIIEFPVFSNGDGFSRIALMYNEISCISSKPVENPNLSTVYTRDMGPIVCALPFEVLRIGFLQVTGNEEAAKLAMQEAGFIASDELSDQDRASIESAIDDLTSTIEECGREYDRSEVTRKQIADMVEFWRDTAIEGQKALNDIDAERARIKKSMHELAAQVRELEARL